MLSYIDEGILELSNRSAVLKFLKKLPRAETMIKRTCLITLLVLFLLHAGCARPNIQLETVLVYNATAEKITDVTIRHEPTNRTASVSLILPGKSLDIGFPAQPMLGRKGIVSWRDGAGRVWQVELTLPYDSAIAGQGRAMTLVYMISAPGNASVSLR
jgi:hypothetical protein